MKSARISIAFALGLSACSAQHLSYREYRDSDTEHGREWLELSAGVADRHQRSSDPVDDAPTLAIGGGVALVDGPLRPSLEIQAFGARHDVAESVSPGNNPHLDVGLFLGGMRVDARLGDSPLTLYVRGGMMWREEFERPDGIGVAQDQWGTYLGGGLEWLFSYGVSIGPYFLYTRGNEDGLEETLFGLSVRFSLPPE